MRMSFRRHNIFMAMTKSFGYYCLMGLSPSTLLCYIFVYIHVSNMSVVQYQNNKDQICDIQSGLRLLQLSMDNLQKFFLNIIRQGIPQGPSIKCKAVAKLL